MACLQHANIGRQVQTLSKILVSEGFNTVDTLVAEVKKTLQKFDPDVTDRQVKDLITGAGTRKRPTKKQNENNLADLKKQLREEAKLEKLLKKSKDKNAKGPLKKIRTILDRGNFSKQN